jgi:hypothetical protein
VRRRERMESNTWSSQQEATGIQNSPRVTTWSPSRWKIVEDLSHPPRSGSGRWSELTGLLVKKLFNELADQPADRDVVRDAVDL